MKNTNIKVDFFRVVVDGTYNHLESLIDYIDSLPDDDSRCLDLGKDAKIRLQKKIHDNDFYKGDIVRIKMDDVPIKASGRSSIAAPIDLKDDEGIGKENAFLYHVPSRILLLQRTNLGVSSHNFNRYFQEKTPSPCAVNLMPILDGDVLERINKMKSIKKIDLKFDDVENKEFLRKNNMAAGAAFDLIDNYDALQVSMEISVGIYRKRELNKSNILSTITSLITQGNRKGHVTGTNDENRQEVIDLSEVTMRAEIPISYPGRTITYDIRKNALIEAWAKKKDVLKTMYDKIV